MTPVFQTQFVATHGKGNCVQAAFASLLDLKLDEVPAFRDLPACDFDDAIDGFLDSRGLRRIVTQFDEKYVPHSVRFVNCSWHAGAKVRISRPCIAFGKSPRGNTNHAVVGQIWGTEFELLHDPHPDGTGIVGHPLSIHFVVPQ